MTRIFDILFSCLGLICLSPILLVIYILIKTESKGPGLYAQKRIGKDGKPFKLLKFRTMREGSDKGNQITIGEDERITKTGRHLRKYKLDELPQLVNVIKGEMSLVGPRPEVEKYVRLYTPEQRVILSVLPGITDYASIQYSNENEILGKAEDPHKMYVEEIMPKKIEYNMKYIKDPSLSQYFKIIFLTVSKIIKH